MLGDAKIIQNGVEKIIEVGAIIKAGDIIKTGDNSIVVASFDEKAAEVEVQSNAVFSVEKFDDAQKIVRADAGNVWFRVNKKLSKKEQYLLKTPTTVAAVRGTKMFSFKMGDMEGMCHCEGNVDYSVTGSEYRETHSRDHIVLTKGSKTILLTAEDIPFLITPGEVHKHSELENSPLGPKSIEMSPEIHSKFMAVVEEKFRALE